MITSPIENIALGGFLELIVDPNQPKGLTEIAQLCPNFVSMPAYEHGAMIHLILPRLQSCPDRYQTKDRSDGITIVNCPAGEAAQLYANLHWPPEWF